VIDNSADLAILEDREAVAQVTRTYARSFDLGDWKSVRSCFARNGVILGMRGPRFADDFVGNSERLAREYTGTMHVITNQQVAVMGDRAHVDSQLTAYHWKGSPPGMPHPEDLIGGAYYRDDLVREDGRWVIAFRHLVHCWGVGPFPHGVSPAGHPEQGDTRSSEAPA
jgi:hypothetical protein